jgi:hypothetical protein
LSAFVAALYGVETKALNQAVKRNAEKFPSRISRLMSRRIVRSRHARMCPFRLRHEAGTSYPRGLAAKKGKPMKVETENVKATEAGAAFLGSQGDVWDAQKDILCDTLGAICSSTLFLLREKR